jgi:hypothetical protein
LRAAILPEFEAGELPDAVAVLDEHLEDYTGGHEVLEASEPDRVTANHLRGALERAASSQAADERPRALGRPDREQSDLRT